MSSKTVEASPLHLLRKAHRFSPFRLKGAFVVILSYYAVEMILSAALHISPRAILTDLTTAGKALLLAFSIPLSVVVLDDFDRGFTVIRSYVPQDQEKEFRAWIKEFTMILEGRSVGSAFLYVVGTISMILFAAYLLFLNPYIHQSALDLYAKRGIVGSTGEAFINFDFVSFFLPMCVMFVLALGIWLSGITWLVLGVNSKRSLYTVGRMWPESAFWRKILSSVLGCIAGKPWIGRAIAIEPNPYHHDRRGGLKTVIDLHFRAMIIIAISIGLLMAYALQGLALIDGLIVAFAIGNIIFITFILINYSSHRFLSTLRQKEFSILEDRLFTLRSRFSTGSERSLTEAGEASIMSSLIGEIEKIPSWPVGVSRAALSIATPVITFVIERYLATVLGLTV